MIKHFFLILIVCLSACEKQAERQTSITTKKKEIKNTQVTSKQLEGKELESFLIVLEKKFAEIRSLKVDFIQEKHLEMLSKPSIGKGILCFKQPKSIRFEMTQPFHSILIVDDEKVARYERTDNNWKKLQQGSTKVLSLVMNQITTWLQGNFREQSSIYHISAKQSEIKTVILTPKHKQLLTLISSIELGLNKKETRFDTVTIKEPGGDYTLLKLEKETRNPILPAKIFDTRAELPQEIK